jgi:hypothetical protein
MLKKRKSFLLVVNQYKIQPKEINITAKDTFAIIPEIIFSIIV